MCGIRAREFRKMKNKTEDLLDQNGFEYFFIGPLVNKGIYRINEQELGSRFMQNLVDVNFGYPGEQEILTPEGTYPTITYFLETGRLSAKIFYSEEFMRLEPYEKVAEGKTRAFWQMGFEIIGKPLGAANLEVIKTLMQIADLLEIPVTINISDKTILDTAIGKQDFETREKILAIIDDLKEDPDAMQRELSQIDQTGQSVLIPKMMRIKDVGKLPRDLGFGYNARTIDGSKIETVWLNVIRTVERVSKEAPKFASIKAVPLIPKGFDAYNNFIVEMRGPFEDLGALAGGGDYTACAKAFGERRERMPVMTGVGIGLTRMLETKLRMEGMI